MHPDPLADKCPTERVPDLPLSLSMFLAAKAQCTIALTPDACIADPVSSLSALTSSRNSPLTKGEALSPIACYCLGSGMLLQAVAAG